MGSFEALSQAPVIGLARVTRPEKAKIFGGLINVEDSIFPLRAMKYVQGVDVNKIEGGVARNARFRHSWLRRRRR